ncbi:uberolysin/carnocyclin family circular bacteriocin [Bacillus paranthracis]|uniref:Bacteriocin class IId cyclical uberolysin-like protein n=1 Tax=Bacillus paranthracis TaxID=2026186 RepID=A0A5M9GQ24_9BACI|nr:MULTISPECIES: uberolysin/carnocyclin family circular bacteriocin [Bacillus]EJP90924.1 circularin A/uberolysin family circular bacteriocin [Bacillus cereus IS075]EJR04657.1 circularin A/uberolysin family circular bacteriocin [Bacillus cereus MSX-A12]EOO92291.1 circularin A/uberolysin family circular bacteriocin [Bacillus cereus IS845/00]EOO98427.1 circularin A/uberolysin family circular bacteriocin [Bacillus cereus IS195]CKE94882.1 circular bacteriocin%2C circularin A/uberolysin family [Stre
MGLFHVASKFKISQGIAGGVVAAVLNAGTLISAIGAVTVVMSGGIDAILEVGWTAFVATVKEQAAKRGTAGAVAW